MLVDHVRPDMRLAWEEPFGPVVPVIRITTVEEGVHHCNANNFGLQVRLGPPCSLMACIPSCDSQVYLLHCLLRMHVGPSSTAQ